jgi:hypothetical protein
VMGTTEKEVADGEGGIRCFIAVSSGRPISRKTGLPVPEEHLLAVVGRPLLH